MPQQCAEGVVAFSIPLSGVGAAERGRGEGLKWTNHLWIACCGPPCFSFLRSTSQLDSVTLTLAAVVVCCCSCRLVLPLPLFMTPFLDCCLLLWRSCFTVFCQDRPALKAFLLGGVLEEPGRPLGRFRGAPSTDSPLTAQDPSKSGTCSEPIFDS